MDRVGSRHWRGPSPAMVVAIIALIVALAGTAVAAKQSKLSKNSVGSRQLKAKSVTTGKIANNAVNGQKVANGSLTGEDINLNALGTVPSAVEASHAANADAISGHAAACPAGTTPIRGLCFDSSSNGPAANLKAASEACAAKGGFLPTPMELYSVKDVLHLSGQRQFTDSFYTEDNGTTFWTITVNGEGKLEQLETNDPARFHCVYPLIR